MEHNTQRNGLRSHAAAVAHVATLPLSRFKLWEATGGLPTLATGPCPVEENFLGCVEIPYRDENGTRRSVLAGPDRSGRMVVWSD